MSISLAAYKLALNEQSSTTKENGLIDTLQNALNNLGDPSYGAFVSGLIFDLAKIKQNGASAGQVPMWDGVKWAPTTPGGTAYIEIQTTTLGADGTFSFTGISGSYKALQLVCYLRSDRAATEDDLGIRFNNDTAANYDGYAVKISGAGPTVAGTENAGATSLRIAAGVNGNTAGANLFSSAVITIPYYANVANNKAVDIEIAKKIGTAAGNFHVMFGSGGWRSNAAINRVDLLPVGGGANFKAGSTVSLYGM